jgi:hypothetical protein
VGHGAQAGLALAAASMTRALLEQDRGGGGVAGPRPDVGRVSADDARMSVVDTRVRGGDNSEGQREDDEGGC